MVSRVMSREELRAIHSAGTGFVYNDNWTMIHKASCPMLGQMKVYTGSEEYENPGAKYFDSSREALVAWAQTPPSPVSPNFCKSCNP
jgi:hypothetical protein